MNRKSLTTWLFLLATTFPGVGLSDGAAAHDLKSALARADAVFIGEVTTWYVLASRDPERFPGLNRVVYFNVREVLKGYDGEPGISKGRVGVNFWNIDNCSIDFEKGTTYLVLATRDKPVLESQFCEFIETAREDPVLEARKALSEIADDV